MRKIKIRERLATWLFKLIMPKNVTVFVFPYPMSESQIKNITLFASYQMLMKEDFEEKVN
jgi:hypothetical protein